MVQRPKVLSVLSCTFVLGLGLSHTALALENSGAPEEIRAEQNTERKGNLPGLVKQNEELQRGIHTMKGEVLRVEVDHYVIKRNDGKQVSLLVDQHTQVTRIFSPGEWIEAKVTHMPEGHHAESISPISPVK